MATDQSEQLRQSLSGIGSRTPDGGRPPRGVRGRQRHAGAAGRRHAAVAVRPGGVLSDDRSAAGDGLRRRAAMFPDTQQFRYSGRGGVPAGRASGRYSERHAVDLGDGSCGPDDLLPHDVRQYDPQHRPACDRLRTGTVSFRAAGRGAAGGPSPPFRPASNPGRFVGRTRNVSAETPLLQKGGRGVFFMVRRFRTGCSQVRRGGPFRNLRRIIRLSGIRSSRSPRSSP